MTKMQGGFVKMVFDNREDMPFIGAVRIESITSAVIDGKTIERKDTVILSPNDDNPKNFLIFHEKSTFVLSWEPPK